MDWLAIQQGKPFITKEDVPGLVRNDYGLICKEIKQLDCYDSKNFMIRVEEKMGITDVYGTKFVFKVMNSEFCKHSDAMRNCTEILAFLSGKGFNCPVPVKNSCGDILRLVPMKDPQNNSKEEGSPSEKVFMFRLYTFIDGITLKDVEVVNNNVFSQAGSLLGKMHNALEDFNRQMIPAIEKWNRDYPWTLDNVVSLKPLLTYVTDDGRRKMALDIIKRFDSEVLKHRSSLRKGYLHGDFNDVNLLVNPPEPGAKEHVQIIRGVIDFDDCTYAPTVYDLSMSVMYMMQCKVKDPFLVAGLFFRSYDKVRKLTELEREVTILCSCARFVQSLICGLYSYSFHKDPYALGTQERGWMALELLYQKDWKVLMKEWEELEVQ